jgi:nucleoside-diphosphate-sugar epimerase
MSLQNSTIFVTGGTGFIGINLLRRLEELGAQTVALVRPGANLVRLRSLNKLRIRVGDVTDAKMISDLMVEIQPDYVFHLATSRENATPDERLRMITSNTCGITNLLEGCLRAPHCRIICTGSSMEYGYRKEPFHENRPSEPDTLFGASKEAATNLCMAYHKQYALQVVVLRLFHVYGYWEPSHRLVPTVIDAALTGNPIRLTASATRRDFVFVEDVVDAYVMAAGRKRVNGQIINIGTGIQHTNRDVVAGIERISGRRISVEASAFPERSYDRDFWVADIQRAKEMLGWMPQTPLIEGLRKSYEWAKQNHSALTR